MITRQDPSRQGVNLRRAMEQLLDRSVVGPGLMRDIPSQAVPAMDICETQNGYEVDIALPGARAEDIELVVDQNTLTIRGDFSNQSDHQDLGQDQAGRRGRRQRHQRGHNWLAREIIYGEFERSITFPKPIDVDNVQTIFENGILTITLPVSEANRPRQISVTDGQRQSQQITAGTGQPQGQQQGQPQSQQRSQQQGQQKGQRQG